jgi:hypothetical protein
MERKDLFENYKDMPDNLKVICDKWGTRFANEGSDYIKCAQFLKEVEAIGYTFEYGLDAEPYDLVNKR